MLCPRTYNGFVTSADTLPRASSYRSSGSLTLRRLQIVLLLLAIVSVPAAARATQHLSHQPAPHDNPGFKTSGKSAPQKVTIARDVAVVRHVEAVDSPILRTARSFESFEQLFPSSPTLPAPRSLRAPPSSSFA
jgi:hypothetical protein